MQEVSKYCKRHYAALAAEEYYTNRHRPELYLLQSQGVEHVHAFAVSVLDLASVSSSLGSSVAGDPLAMMFCNSVGKLSIYTELENARLDPFRSTCLLSLRIPG